MPKEERQRKLHNQYYFHCGCTACSKSWPLYPSITTTALPLSSIPVTEHKAVTAELGKHSKGYKKTFDGVLAGHFGEALPVLLEHLSYLDSHVCRPLREYNDCQGRDSPNSWQVFRTISLHVSITFFLCFPELEGI
jgi:hypothetical protein